MPSYPPEASNEKIAPANVTNSTTKTDGASRESVIVTPVIPNQDEDQTEPAGHDGDLDLVDWNSNKDPRRPVNWPMTIKVANVAIISFLTFLTPLASSMVAPAVPLLISEFNLDPDGIVTAFIVSIYLLGYALGPLVIAPLSEVYGRQWVYFICNALFAIWNAACALAPNIPSLLFFRFCAGLAGSCPLTIGASSIGDLFIQEQRGAAISIYSAGPVFGPVMGPVVGGYLAEAKGWRWTFWILTIGAGASSALGAFIQRETYEPVLLERIAARRRKETGNTQLRSKLASTLPKKQYFIRALVRPTKMLVLSPIVLTLSLYVAVVYAYMYLLFTTITLVFERNYEFNSGNVGLTFLGIGIGSIIGIGCVGASSDWILKVLAKRQGELKPEYRLPPLMIGALCTPIGLFWHGWSIEAGQHWIMPIIGTAWVGFGNLAIMMPVTVYLVDTFTLKAASALAANTILRSLLGAFLPLAGPKMFQVLGLGWGSSLLAFIALAMAPISWVFYRYGESIRKKNWVIF